MNNCFHIYSSPYNFLESFTTSIRDNFCINFTIPVEYSEYNCLTTCTSATFTFLPALPSGREQAGDSSSSIPINRDIDFDFSFKGRFHLTKLGNASAHGNEIPVDCIAIEMGKFSNLNGIQIQGKQLDQLPEFLLRNSGTLNILVSHSYLRTYNTSCYAS